MRQFLLLAAFVVVVTVVEGIPMSMSFKKSMAAVWPAVVAQLPDPLVLKDGVLSTPEPKPYQILVPTSREVLAVVDTSAGTKAMMDSPSPIFFTARQFRTKKAGGGDVRVQNLPPWSLVLDHPKAERWGRWLGAYAVWVLSLFIFFFSFLYRAAQTFLLGGLAVWDARLLKFHLPYGNGLWAALWGVLPALGLETLFSLFKVALPNLVCAGILFTGTFIAVRLFKSDAEVPPPL